MPHRVIITARGPLAFPTRKPGAQFAQSFPYLPGSALWGALGMRRQQTVEARFSHALPARADDAWVRLLPATAMSCKRHGGFRAEHHGVFDTLIDRVCWEELRPAAFTYDPHCPDCLGRADHPPGSVYAEDRQGAIHARKVQ
jgi:CRISPR-associated protein Csx10